MNIDPRTPVVVGVGQASERLDDPGYQHRSPVDLAADAARDALADTGADPAAVAAVIDTVAGIRQFENSVPGARAPLGRSDNYPRSVAGRIGAEPARAILEVSGGQGPQHLVNEFAATIAAGKAEAVLVFGSEAISTIERYAKAEDRPDFTEHVDGTLEDRGYGLRGTAVDAPGRARPDRRAQPVRADRERPPRPARSRPGTTYAAAMGALFAPFTKVAAANPHAAAPGRAQRRGTGHRRPRPTGPSPTRTPGHRGAGKGQPGRGGAADVGGQPHSASASREDRWVFLHGHADLRERDLMDRADLSPARHR